jgi:hypothetical protein
MLDRSKVPGDLWVRIVWVPRDGGDPDDVPIALAQDRQRLLLGAVLGLLAFLIAILLLLVLRAAPLLASVVFVLLLLAANRVANSGKTGYYQLSPDGSLATFLGRRPPSDLRTMERIKPK